MKSVKSFFRFSSKIVKMDINSILTGGPSKSKGVQLEINKNLDQMTNMLLFYYPISKKHFEIEETLTDNCIEANCSNENIEECINLDCCPFEEKRSEHERKV